MSLVLGMADRMLKLRYRATCARCTAELPPGTEAWWSSFTKTATCSTCIGSLVSSAESAPPDVPPTADVEVEPEMAAVDLGVAGRSAQQRHGHLHDRREQDIRSRFPRIGGAIVALTDDPQSTKAWKNGAEGERHIGGILDGLAPNGVVTLHDRRVPGRRINIDHIAVAPTGVYVIDAKNYKGLVERRDVGGWLRSDVRLYVAGRDRTSLVDGIDDQAQIVREALGEAFDGIPVWPIICFAKSDWRFFSKPFVVGGAQITWPRALASDLTAAGPVGPGTIQAAVRQLGSALPPR